MVSKLFVLTLFLMANSAFALNGVSYFISTKTRGGHNATYTIYRDASGVHYNKKDLGIGALYTGANLWSRLERFKVNSKYKCQSGEFLLTVVKEGKKSHFRSCLEDKRVSEIFKELDKITL